MKKQQENQKFIIRTDRAGVYFGEIKEISGDTAVLRNCRMLYYWAGAATTMQLAVDGVKNPNECKFTIFVDEMMVHGVISYIPCTEKAIKSISNVAIWKL